MAVCMYEFCNMWLCVCMGFVMCGCVYGICNVWVRVGTSFVCVGVRM